MPKAKAGPVSGARLKSFVERIEKLEEERKAIGDDVKDVYSEAHGVGYDKKTIRRMVKERKKDAGERAQEQDLYETYMHAIGEQLDFFRNSQHPEERVQNP